MNFKINQIVFDSENKEIVKITNGITIGQNDNSFVPTEALAVRFCGFSKNNKPILALTYRKVNSEKLSICKDIDNRFEVLIDGKNPNINFIGRV